MASSTTEYREPTAEQRVFFRNMLRGARAKALRDAEGFQELFFGFERLGGFLVGKKKALKGFEGALSRLANESSLANDVPHQHPGYHTPFAIVLRSTRLARNDAFHEGAQARHITESATLVALVLEDALMSQSTCIREFMVREPVVARPWEPLSFVRQRMLANSFSYLPIEFDPADWRLLSDLALARYLSKGPKKTLLAQSVATAAANGLDLPVVEPRHGDTTIESALEKADGKPILVVEDGILMGIATPFDLL